MRSSFPKVQNPLAAAKLKRHEKQLKIIASKLFTFNHKLFSQIGMDRSDVESIISIYSYIYFDAHADSKPEVLFSFIKQRSIRLIEVFNKKKDDGFVDEATDLTDLIRAEIMEAHSHCDDPESILIAKETLQAYVFPESREIQ